MVVKNIEVEINGKKAESFDNFLGRHPINGDVEIISTDSFPKTPYDIDFLHPLTAIKQLRATRNASVVYNPDTYSPYISGHITGINKSIENLHAVLLGRGKFSIDLLSKSSRSEQPIQIIRIRGKV